MTDNDAKHFSENIRRMIVEQKKQPENKIGNKNQLEKILMMAVNTIKGENTKANTITLPKTQVKMKGLSQSQLS